MAPRRASADAPGGNAREMRQQELAAVIKRARNIMRVDPGLNGDLDRLPQLAWLLFLKAYDDLELDRTVTEADYVPLMPERYRWSGWARDERLTGDRLIKFVNDELLPALRALPDAPQDRESADVMRAVFAGVDNRMHSGYQLRELLNELDKVHLKSQDDIYTLAFLYESMIREVRDAAGDSGEFYTPRPVVRFMVAQVAPAVGETVLDPAAGTGGFLVETLDRLLPEAKNSVSALRTLHESLRGFEKKPLPYLLGTMNLILHGVDVPHLRSANSLVTLMTDKSKASQVDVVLTNPPFGGAESRDVVEAFPTTYRTAETAWLFLYTVMEKLKPGGRCGMIVPNGVLFDGGVGARIKERLLETCDLHTIVRLPDGVFAPYTSIPSNLLFFEKGGPTREVWFYELPPPEGRKRYSKTKPMQYDEFAACQEWWGGRAREGRVENEHSWRVLVNEIRDREFSLDLRNPRNDGNLSHRPPDELVQELIATEQEIARHLEYLQRYLVGAR